MNPGAERRVPVSTLRRIWWDVSASLADVVAAQGGLVTVRMMNARARRFGWPSRRAIRSAAWRESGLLVKLWSRGDLTFDEIGARLGYTGRHVCHLVRAAGLPPRAKLRRVDYDVDLVRRAWLAGVAGSDIARHFGREQSTISSKRRHLDLPARRAGFRPTMTMDAFLAAEAEAQLAAAMAADAARVRAAHAERAAAERRVLSDFSGEIAA